MSNSTGTLSLINVPHYVGHYRVGGAMGISFSLTKKPRWLHRAMMRWCFGWVWEDVR